MRDIRPYKPPNQDSPFDPIEPKREEIDYYEATEMPKRKISARPATVHQAVAGRDFSGTAVPIATSTERHSQPDNKESHGQKSAQPMFYKQTTAKTSQVRIGSNERKIILSLFGLVLVVAVIAGAIFIPTAHFNLQLRTAPLLLNEEMVIEASHSEMIGNGTSFLREINISGTQKVTSRENVGVKSTGTVNIINRTGETQKIKENSRLVTKDNALFFMKTHAIVSPTASAQVEVEAAEPGEAGNIDPQPLYFAALDESARKILFADATNKFTGGKSEMIAVVTDNDLDEAKKAARQKGQQEADAEIRTALPDNWTILEESWAHDVTEYTATAQAGDKVPEFDYSAHVTVRVMAYTKKTLEDKLKDRLEQKMEADYMLFPGPISYTQSVSDVNWENATVALSLRVTHMTIPKLSLGTLKEKMAGRSAEEAKNYLEGLPAVKTATIELWPFWVNSIPKIEKRISIDLAAEEKP